MEFYLTIKRSELITPKHGRTMKETSERNLTQKRIYCMIPFILNAHNR